MEATNQKSVSDQTRSGTKTNATSPMEWNTMLGFSLRLKQDGLLRDYLLILMGSHFGLRISDLLKLRWRDVAGREEFQIIEGKTKKRRIIIINRAVSDAVDFCMNIHKRQTNGTFDENGYVFANRYGGRLTVSYINKRLKFLFRTYNLKIRKMSSHSLRKTFGRRVYEADSNRERSLVILSEIFSHTSIATTRRYIGLTEENIANIYLNL